MDDQELDLIDTLGSFAYDPLAFVQWAFPWGEPGTELARQSGPDEWQVWVLSAVRDNLLTVEQAFRLAVTSGHGVGKSCLVAWLTWWAFSTFPGTRGVVTANTENQLKTKTWVEIAKWHRLFIGRELFKCTATALFAIDEAQSREWRIDIVPWSEKNTEAFAGLHNAGKRIIIIFDEASAIPDIIWETTEGAMTDEDTEILWFVFGNPTRNTGRFRECFEGGQFAHRWRTRIVNSLEVLRTNKKELQAWIDDYGIDSDFVRVRVLGLFPGADSFSFITRDLAHAAATRELLEPARGPVVLGVDVARFGDDLSVIWPRQGRDALSRPPRFFQNLSLDMLAQEVIRAYNDYNASMVFIDGGGVGAGVVDICRAMQLRVHEVQFGAAPDGLDTTALYMNKRAEIYGLLRAFLKDGSIPLKVADRDFVDELTGPTYTLKDSRKGTVIQLESKEMMKRRSLPSPDFADALACTFAMPAAAIPSGLAHKTPPSDYNPHEMEFGHEQAAS